MRVPDDHPLNLTLALRRYDTVTPALDAFAGRDDPTTTDGLLELATAEQWAKPTLIAVDRLTATDSPLSLAVLRRAFASRFAPVRLLACSRVRDQKRTGFTGELLQVLRTDDSWPNRRAALRALADDNSNWAILAAADDPHWRVRHALIRVLLERPPEVVFTQLEQCLAEPRPPVRRQRVEALIAYLRFALFGTEPADWSAFTPPDPMAQCPFWDWDPAVLAATLNRMTADDRREHLETMPFLAGHTDERVWKPAVDTIRKWGEPAHYQAVVDQLADPRNGVQSAVYKLLDGLDEETKDALVFPPPPATTAP